MYLNSGNGFASTPTSWALPLYGTCTFNQGTSGSTRLGPLSYSTRDMSGNGKPDLVVSAAASSCTTTVPTTQWLVYAAACQ